MCIFCVMFYIFFFTSFSSVLPYFQIQHSILLIVCILDECANIDKCSKKTLNKCIRANRGSKCHNLVASYSCSCVKCYKGDDYIDGTRCQSISLNHIIFLAIAGKGILDKLLAFVLL